MKSNYRIFTAVFLSAVLTATAPLTVCGAEVFSAGEYKKRCDTGME